MSLGLITGNVLYSFGGVRFPWFSCSLLFCTGILKLEGAVTFSRLWTGLSGERHSPTGECESSGWVGRAVALGLGICADSGSRGIQEHWFWSGLCSSGWQGLREQCTAATLAGAQSFHLLSWYATLAVMCSPTCNHSEPLCLECLWRLHYLGMVNSITGHWWLIESPACLSSLEVTGWGWRCQPSNHLVGSADNKFCILRRGLKETSLI